MGSTPSLFAWEETLLQTGVEEVDLTSGTVHGGILGRGGRSSRR